MKKQTAYIFAAFVVVLIILAIVIMWLTGGIGGGEQPAATPTPEVVTDAPRQTQFVIPTETPAPTEAVPTPTAAPTPTPAPTPETPSGKVLASGAFDSSTGVGINTHTTWTAAEQADGSVKLTLSVYVRSYTMEIGSRAITVSVDGSSASGMTRAFDVDSPNAQTDTLIYTYSTTVAKGSGISVSVDWKYKGQYSGQDLDVISSSASIPAL